MQILLIEDDAMMGSTLTQGLSDLGLPPPSCSTAKR